MANHTELDNAEILKELRAIRQHLEIISTCHEDQYREILRKRNREKVEIFEKMLTETKRKIFPLLFDPRGLSQVEIADAVATTQPTVSRFVSTLLEQELIEPVEDADGHTVYKDNYDLLRLM